MVQGFTDIHCHLIYGVDDGPQTLEQSVAMVQAAYKDGVRTVIATSHICPGIQEFRADLYLQHLEELRSYCASQSIDLRILTGAEILYSQLTGHFLRDGRIFSLGDSEYVLVEFLPDVTGKEIQEALTEILRSGYRPVIAHVERYPNVFGSVRKMSELKADFDALLQMNCATVLGGKGWHRDKAARRMIEEGLIDMVATDAHNTSSRPTRMRRTYDFLSDNFSKEEARMLTGMQWGKPDMRQ